MLEDPTTKEKIEISNAVVIKTICDYDSAKQWMEKCNISFVSDEGKGIRGIDQFVFDNREYTYLIYSKNNIDNEDINNKVKYLVIEDMENDKNYVLEVPNQEGIMIYLK